MYLIIEWASRYPRVLLMEKKKLAWNAPFSQLRSHNYYSKVITIVAN